MLKCGHWILSACFGCQRVNNKTCGNQSVLLCKAKLVKKQMGNIELHNIHFSWPSLGQTTAKPKASLRPSGNNPHRCLARVNVRGTTCLFLLLRGKALLYTAQRPLSQGDRRFMHWPAVGLSFALLASLGSLRRSEKHALHAPCILATT